MKKNLLLVILAIIFTANFGRAESVLRLGMITGAAPDQTAPANPTSLRLTSSSDATLTGRGSDFARGLDRASGQSFAQLSSNSKSMPMSPTWTLALVIGAGVVVWRMYGLKTARELADHERQTHHARTQMYRSLQARD